MKEIEDERALLDLEYRRLELQKLAAEVKQGSLLWWKRPGYLGGLTPIALALIGVATAWTTGFFDTQRAKLADEIAVLTEEKRDLTEDIDLVYLRLRLATGEVEYALGHFYGFSEEFTGAVTQLEDLRGDMQPEVAAATEHVISLSAARGDIVQIAEASLQTVSGQLDSIDASGWAKGLQTEPYLSSLELFKSPDDRFFDVGEGRFLSDEEAKAKLGDWWQN